MKHYKLKVNIENFNDKEITCLVENNLEIARILYSQQTQEIFFQEDNILAETIRNYQFQFVKILRSAAKGVLCPGQVINCVLIENFNFLNEVDYNKYIRIDTRNNKLEIKSYENSMTGCYRLFTDGSYAIEQGYSGYGGIIENTEGEQEVFCQSFKKGASNLMELMAVIEGLQHLSAVAKIQINTDSRFVIRGMAQWVHFWKLNNWQTAYGSQVKYTQHWKQLDRLFQNKLVELKWIKGHSGHTEQDFCHRLARKSAKI
ncbi:MAG: ribonuclease HI [Bacteroidales bacterium]|nr:ribonuclease HI [Bacteroidales bacterium]MBN2819916.1 ribonuclease HI [Bacteroidales bacterium]